MAFIDAIVISALYLYIFFFFFWGGGGGGGNSSIPEIKHSIPYPWK